LAFAARIRSRSVSMWASGDSLGGNAADDVGPGLTLDAAVEPAATEAGAGLEADGAGVVPAPGVPDVPGV